MKYFVLNNNFFKNMCFTLATRANDVPYTGPHSLHLVNQTPEYFRNTFLKKCLSKMIMDRVEQFECIQKNALEVFRRKNADYGDAFATYGLVGVLVRIGDKIQRAVSVTNSGINLVEDESLRDTLLDLHNYAAMALILEKQLK